MQAGQEIEKLRRKAGLTQEQLAEALYVSRDLISKWETGTRLPDYRMVLKIAELFVVSPDEIIERDALLLSELQILFPKDYPSDPDKLKKDINAFLGTLTMRDASVFVRKYYFFETPAEISELYGIKEDYVRTVLMRTRRKLKKYLKEAV